MKYKGILLIGPPGCGKGTQGKLLDDKEGYFHFSSGEMFRNLDLTTEIGARVKTLIDAGNFVDDQTTVALAKETLQRYVRQERFNPQKDYLVLDGIPRNVPQVSMVNDFVNIEQIIRIHAPNQVCTVRLLGRAEKEGREDDADLTKIQKRLNIYHYITTPLLESYDPKIIVTVESLLDPEEVHKDLWKVIRS